jgi:hypothetical protein
LCRKPFFADSKELILQPDSLAPNPMIIYNVTVKIDTAFHDEWLQWMKETHIPDVMSSGCFTENRMLKVLTDETDGSTYSIQYSCHSMNDFLEYEHRHAAKLRAEHSEKYRDKFVAFRTLLEVV